MTARKISVLLICLSMTITMGGCGRADTVSDSSSAVGGTNSDGMGQTQPAEGTQASEPEGMESLLGALPEGGHGVAASTPSNAGQSEGRTGQASGATVCQHKNTEIRGVIAATITTTGYSGDVYCKDCGAKLSEGGATFLLPDGTMHRVDGVASVSQYALKAAGKTAEHQYSEIEQEILRLCNIERQKVGAKPLSWLEEAYYFTKIRADECHTSYSHTRPNGERWITVYQNEKVFIDLGAENLVGGSTSRTAEIAKTCVDEWMNSPAHRASILNADYAFLCVAVTSVPSTKLADGVDWFATQHFFK